MDQPLKSTKLVLPWEGTEMQRVASALLKGAQHDLLFAVLWKYCQLDQPCDDLADKKPFADDILFDINTTEAELQEMKKAESDHEILPSPAPWNPPT